MWAGLTPDSKGDPTSDTEESVRRRQETPQTGGRETRPGDGPRRGIGIRASDRLTLFNVGNPPVLEFSAGESAHESHKKNKIHKRRESSTFFF